MAKIADIAYKTTTGFLGLATILFGVNLMFNVSRGIAWHLENSDGTYHAVCALMLLGVGDDGSQLQLDLLLKPGRVAANLKSHTAVVTEPPLPSSEGSANGKD